MGTDTIVRTPMDGIPIVMTDEPDEDETGRLHNGTGKFTAKFTDDDFLAALRDLGGEAGTSQVADEVGCPHSTAFHRLERLSDEGRVQRRDLPAGNAVLWVVDNE